jgi:hypothetical protein
VDLRIVQQQEAQYLNIGFNHAGVTLWELWLRYYSLGGDASEPAVAAHLAGESALPGIQQQILHVALSELSAEATPQSGAGSDPFAAGQTRILGIAPEPPSR